MRGTASKLSLDLARGTGVHWARLLWVVAVRIFGEPARLSIGNQQDQSQAAPHSPITRDLRENQCFTKLRAPTTDRLLVAACRQGHPCRSCAHEDLWSQGSRHGSTPPACVVGALPTTRAVALLYWPRKVACFLIFTSIHKKQCQISFLLMQHFRFFLVYFWQQPRWSRGVECVWAQPLLRCRDNLAYSVILFTMF